MVKIDISIVFQRKAEFGVKNFVTKSVTLILLILLLKSVTLTGNFASKLFVTKKPEKDANLITLDFVLSKRRNCGDVLV